MRQTLKWLIAGSRGGDNRLRIIRTLNEQPFNRNQLAKQLELDYTTVQYHLDVLVKQNVVDSQDEKYGKLFFLTEQMHGNMDLLDEIAEQAGIE